MSQVPPANVEGGELLESLQYEQELKRKLNILGNVSLTLSDITPTASLLIVGALPPHCASSRASSRRSRSPRC
ncbi:MAG TPA: hypothetical protein VG223_08400 [Solirubrobacteraceae bacterium]|jgi:hypothetical protein|nr:hypothetical protein [Solirubrobacteraceae bacterium]